MATLCGGVSSGDMSDLYAKAGKLNDQFISAKWLGWYFGPVLLLLVLGTLFYGREVAIYGAGASVALLLCIAGALQVLIGIGALQRKDFLTGLVLAAFGLLLVSAALSFIIGLVSGAYA